MAGAKKTGRPTALTKQVQDDLVAALRRVWYLGTACDLAGVGRRTVYTWLKIGRKEKSGPHCEFRHAIKKAMAETMADCLDIIQNAAADQWQAAAWKLERRHPREWGGLAREMKEIRRELEALRRGDALDAGAAAGDPPGQGG